MLYNIAKRAFSAMAIHVHQHYTYTTLTHASLCSEKSFNHLSDLVSAAKRFWQPEYSQPPVAIFGLIRDVNLNAMFSKYYWAWDSYRHLQ